jgi:cell division protein ZapB
MTIEVSKNDKKTPFFIVALVVLALVNIILVYLMMQNKQESIDKDAFIDKQRVELEETGSKLDSVYRELDIKIAEAKKMNRDYQALLDIQEQLKADIVNAKKSKADIEKLVREYDAKIKNYEALLAQKEGEIKNLQGENKELSKEVIKSKTEKTKLADSISNIQKQKQELEATVAKASVLKSEALKIEGIDGKNRVDDDGRFKAKNLERLKVSVKLLENNAAKVGNKEMYMRIIEPSGAVMVGADGGRFKDANGKDMNYTTVQTFLFDNVNRNVVLIFRKGNQFQKGTHIVELYCEGSLVGKGSFDVN